MYHCIAKNRSPYIYAKRAKKRSNIKGFQPTKDFSLMILRAYKKL